MKHLTISNTFVEDPAHEPYDFDGTLRDWLIQHARSFFAESFALRDDPAYYPLPKDVPPAEFRDVFVECDETVTGAATFVVWNMTTAKVIIEFERTDDEDTTLTIKRAQPSHSFGSTKAGL